MNARNPVVALCALKRVVAASLTVSVLFSIPAMAVSDYAERFIELGPVNGTVTSNATVEVTRFLPNPVLFEVNRAESGFVPTTLVVQDAKGISMNNQTLVLRKEQQITDEQGQQRVLSAEYPVQLQIDGKRVPITWVSRGSDVEITVPISTQTAYLLSTEPVRMQIPTGYRGDVSLSLEVIGEDSSNAVTQ